ncbi:DUF6898 family protein [Flaviflagellibacter deserti]|uniref:DUF6898 family protein n=1 Tax=Flaviflagellibacter deserti TaxID=2267266 RepID=A0ABV9Z552_9HYPH
MASDRSPPHNERGIARRGSHGDVYFEFRALGGSMKVSAICPETGTEVSIVGPVNASRADLQRLALRKLEMKLGRPS